MNYQWLAHCFAFKHKKKILRLLCGLRVVWAHLFVGRHHAFVVKKIFVVRVNNICIFISSTHN